MHVDRNPGTGTRFQWSSELLIILKRSELLIILKSSELSIILKSSELLIILKSCFQWSSELFIILKSSELLTILKSFSLKLPSREQACKSTSLDQICFMKLHSSVNIHIIKWTFWKSCCFVPSIPMHRNADVYRKSHHIKSSNIPFSSAALFPKLPLFANVYLSDGLVNCIGFQPSILGYLWKTYDTEDLPSVTGAVWWRGDWKSAIGYCFGPNIKDTWDLEILVNENQVHVNLV